MFSMLKKILFVAYMLVSRTLFLIAVFCISALIGYGATALCQSGQTEFGPLTAALWKSHSPIITMVLWASGATFLIKLNDCIATLRSSLKKVA